MSFMNTSTSSCFVQTETCVFQGYSDVAVEDDKTRQFKELVPQWRSICGRGDDEVGFSWTFMRTFRGDGVTGAFLSLNKS